MSLEPWLVDYADGSTYFEPLLSGKRIRPTGNANTAYFDRPWLNRELDRIARLSGRARSRAYASLDVKLMRDDPPWAPVMAQTVRSFVSRSFGCYVYQPVIGRPSLAVACKK